MKNPFIVVGKIVLKYFGAHIQGSDCLIKDMANNNTSVSMSEQDMSSTYLGILVYLRGLWKYILNGRGSITAFNLH